MNKIKRLLPAVLLSSIFVNTHVKVLAMETNDNLPEPSQSDEIDLNNISRIEESYECLDENEKEAIESVQGLVALCSGDSEYPFIDFKNEMSEFQKDFLDRLKSLVYKIISNTNGTNGDSRVVKKLIDDKKILESDKIETYANKLNNEEKIALLSYLCKNFIFMERWVKISNSRSYVKQGDNWRDLELMPKSPLVEILITYCSFLKDCCDLFRVPRIAPRVFPKEFKFDLYEVLHWVLNSLLELPKGYIRVAPKSGTKNKVYTIEFIDKDTFEKKQADPTHLMYVYDMPDDYTELIRHIEKFKTESTHVPISIIEYKGKTIKNIMDYTIK